MTWNWGFRIKPLSCQLQRAVQNLITSYFTKAQNCTKLQSSKQSRLAFDPTQPQNLAPSPYSKARST
jgi:hypothetical protein